MNTSRAKPPVRPMSRSSRSPMSAISSSAEARRGRPPGPGSGVRRAPAGAGSPAGSGRSGRPASRTRAVSRGKRMRATSGTDASTPTAAGQRCAPARSVRLPTWNRCEAVPRTCRVRARRRSASAWPSSTSSVDPVLRPDHDRAERHEVGVGRPAVVHRHAEEARPRRTSRTSGATSSRWRRNDSSRSSRQVTTWNRGRPAAARGLAACRARASSVWVVEPPLVGQVEDPPPLHVRERLDLARPASPTPPRSAGAARRASRPRTWASWNTRKARCSTLGRPGGPSRRAGPPRRARRAGRSKPSAVRAAWARANRSRRSRTARNSTRLPVRDRADHAVAAELDLPDHARPSRAGPGAWPRGTPPTRPRRRRAGRATRGSTPAARLPASSRRASSRGQPAQPAVRRAAGPAVEAAERAVEALVPAGQRPVGQPLVEERGAEPDQHVVDQRVGVDARRLEQQVAVPDGPAAAAADGGRSRTPSQQTRQSAWRVNPSQSSSLQLSIADSPNRSSSSRQPVRRPGRCRRGRGAAWRRLVPAAEVAHHPAPGLGDQPAADRRRGLGPDPPQGVGLGDVPDQLLGRPGPQRVLEHRQAEVQPGAEAGQTGPRPRRPRSSRRTPRGRRTGSGRGPAPRGSGPRSGRAGSRRRRAPFLTASWNGRSSKACSVLWWMKTVIGPWAGSRCAACSMACFRRAEASVSSTASSDP